MENNSSKPQKQVDALEVPTHLKPGNSQSDLSSGYASSAGVKQTDLTVKIFTAKKQPAPGSSAKSLPAGSVNIATFHRQFETIPKLETPVNSVRQITDTLTQINSVLANAENSWSSRVDALKLLQSLAMTICWMEASGQPVISPEVFGGHLQELGVAMQKQVQDLRSQVCREACVTVAFLCECFGLNIDRFAELVVRPLLLQTKTSAKVMASSSRTALISMVRCVPSSRLAHLIIEYCSDKAAQIRSTCFEAMEVMLLEWPSPSPSHYMDEMLVSLERGVADAAPNVRASARQAILALRRQFPGEAGQLFVRLDASRQRQLLQDGFGRSRKSNRRAKLERPKSLNISNGHALDNNSFATNSPAQVQKKSTPRLTAPSDVSGASLARLESLTPVSGPSEMDANLDSSGAMAGRSRAGFRSSSTPLSRGNWMARHVIEQMANDDEIDEIATEIENENEKPVEDVQNVSQYSDAPASSDNEHWSTKSTPVSERQESEDADGNSEQSSSPRSTIYQNETSASRAVTRRLKCLIKSIRRGEFDGKDLDNVFSTLYHCLVTASDCETVALDVAVMAIRTCRELVKARGGDFRRRYVKDVMKCVLEAVSSDEIALRNAGIDCFNMMINRIEVTLLVDGLLEKILTDKYIGTKIGTEAFRLFYQLLPNCSRNCMLQRINVILNRMVVLSEHHSLKIRYYSVQCLVVFCIRFGFIPLRPFLFKLRIRKIYLVLYYLRKAGIAPEEEQPNEIC